MKPKMVLVPLATLMPLIAQAHPGHSALHQNHTHLLAADLPTLAVATLLLAVAVAVVGWRYRRSQAAKRR